MCFRGVQFDDAVCGQNFFSQYQGSLQYILGLCTYVLLSFRYLVVRIVTWLSNDIGSVS